jgi:metal-dependent hydrolase (beta-lactamase superfamily II)
VRHTFGQDPVAVIGGLHLASTDTPTLEHVVEMLAGYGSPQFWVGHCTGDRGFLRLKMAFGDRVALYAVGMKLTVP